jgi:hypothetical protein
MANIQHNEKNSNNSYYNTITFNLDEDMSEKLYKYFLLEQCVYIYNKNIVKVKEIFSILDKFENLHTIDIIELKEFYSTYLFIATESASGTEIIRIIFEYIKNNKYNISINDLDNFYRDFTEINNYILCNQNKSKLYFRRFEECAIKHLSCINNLIRDNNVEGLQIYNDNKLIIEDYYEDIRDSLVFFKCNQNTLNFFEKNHDIIIN